MPLFKLLKPLMLFCLVTLVACSSSTQTSKEKKLPVYAANTLLLLPVKSLHKELISSEPAVDIVLKKYFGKTKFNIVTLSEKQYAEVNKLALEQSGSIYSPAVGDYTPLDTRRYAASMKKLLGEKYEFDTLVIPQIILRSGEVIDDSVEFDGVERKLEYAKGGPTGIKPRTPKGLSIQINAFAAGNNATQPVFGGVSLPFIIQVQDNAPTFVIKPEYFSEAELEEGAKVAIKRLQKQLDYQRNL
jgi:hypothetical protein